MHKAVSCTGCGGHLQNKPLLTRKHWNTSASHIFCSTYFRFWKCFRTNNVEKYSHTLQRAVNLTFTVQWDKGACWALGCFVRCCNGLLVDGECVWERPGVDLEDGGGPSVDLRFADDILVFATSLLVWWTCGCIGTRRFDFELRQNAVANDNNDTETFFATRPCPWGNACSFWRKLLVLLHVFFFSHLFDRCTLSANPCFTVGHSKIYKTDLDTMDVHPRRALAPPSQTNWLTHGTKLCSGGWRFEMTYTTILAFVLVDCWFTRRSMDIKNFDLETPDQWKTWNTISVLAFRRRNPLLLEK